MERSRVPRVEHPGNARPWGRHFALWIGAAILLAGAVGCAASIPQEETATPSPAYLGTVTLSPSECSLEAAGGPIAAGRVSVTARNDTNDLAVFHMWRIADGHTFEEFAGYIAEERQLAERGEPGLGHPGFVEDLIETVLEAGEAGTITGAVRAGTYAIVCIPMFPQAGEPRPFGIVGPVEVR